MYHLCGARVRTLLPHRCRSIPLAPSPPSSIGGGQTCTFLTIPFANLRGNVVRTFLGSLCQCPLCPEFCSYYVPSFFCKPTGYKRTGPAFSKSRSASEQLPCRSAEVKFFSVFLCQNCREIWREILVKFSALRFPEFGCATENFTIISRQKRYEKRKISRKFHSAGAQR